MGIFRTVKPLITNTSEEFIKCRLDNFFKIFISIVETFDFLLNPIFVEIPEFFMASDWLFGFYNQNSDWLQFQQFPGYKCISLKINKKRSIDLDFHNPKVFSSVHIYKPKLSNQIVS